MEVVSCLNPKRWYEMPRVQQEGSVAGMQTGAGGMLFLHAWRMEGWGGAEEVFFVFVLFIGERERRISKNWEAEACC